MFLEFIKPRVNFRGFPTNVRKYRVNFGVLRFHFAFGDHKGQTATLYSGSEAED
jgi:hypothetical protein